MGIILPNRSCDIWIGMLNKLFAQLGRRKDDREYFSPVSGKSEERYGSAFADWSHKLDALPMLNEPSSPSSSDRRLIAVGSGKGGVGKTIVSSNLALAMATEHDSHVTAIDVDLGGANLHNGLGIRRPTFALNRFLLDDAPLEHLAAPSDVERLNYIGGASDIVGLAELSETHRKRFLEEITAMRRTTVVADLGAGSSLFNLDVFCLADHGVVVTTPDPTAVQNAYGFLRAAVYRRLRLLFDGEAGLIEILESAMNHRGDDESDSVPGVIREFARYNRSASSRLEDVALRTKVGVIINMSEGKRARLVAENLAKVTRKYLGLRLDFLGSVAPDESVRQAVCQWRPLLLHFPSSRAAGDLRAIADRLMRSLEKIEALSA